MEKYFVYIIHSEKDGDYYKGFSTDVIKRLEEHNKGLSEFTATKMPWKLVYYCLMDSKRTAIIEEKRIKRLNQKSILNY